MISHLVIDDWDNVYLTADNNMNNIAVSCNIIIWYEKLQ